MATKGRPKLLGYPTPAAESTTETIQFLSSYLGTLKWVMVVTGSLIGGFTIATLVSVNLLQKVSLSCSSGNLK